MEEQGKPELTKCPNCPTEFRAIRHQRYCSDRCRKEAWTKRQARKTEKCLNPRCRKKFEKRKEHHVYCSSKCKMEAWFQRKIDEAIVKQAAGRGITRAEDR